MDSALPETTEAPSTTAQQRFDELYITSTEIGEELNVPRPTVLYARRRGLLPNSVAINDKQIYIWERAFIRPYIDAWKLTLASRRGQLK